MVDRLQEHGQGRQQRSGGAAHEEMLRGTEEALQSGRSTLLAIEKQDELLAASEQNLESQEHIMAQSLRVVRGMTWSGMFYNMVHSRATLDADRAAADQSTDPHSQDVKGRATISAGAGIRGSGSVSATALQQKEELLPSATARTHPDARNRKVQEQEAALDVVSRNLGELHNISVAMGESLDMQNAKLDGIASKADKVSDVTLEVLLKSSQLIDRNSSTTAQFLGEYSFEIHTGGYLSIQDEMLVIGPPVVELSTTFRCFSKGDIFAMLSSRTLKFLATGYFTPVSVSGTRFDKAAHMFLDLSGEYNGILMLSCNWGSGGWVKFGPSGEFTLTSSLRDKDSRVLVRSIPIMPKGPTKNRSYAP